MSRWFRHYAGMSRDDKLVSAALRSKQTVERVIWVWGAILESAAEINDGGRYSLDAAEVAYFLRADEADIRAVLAGLTDAGRLADGIVVNWGERQFQSDKSATRQAAYRERKRAAGSDGHNQQSDGQVTSPSRHRDAPETETETETDSSLRSEARERKTRRKPQIALPTDWRPSADLLASCKTVGLSESEINREVVRFRNHAEQADRRCANWNAAFRNWCLKSAEDRGRSPPLADGEAKAIFVSIDNPKWGGLAGKWREQNQKTTGPPPRDYQGKSGWWFPTEWAATG